MSTSDSLMKEIREEARKTGFSFIGVASPAPPPHLDVYRSWLSTGRHGSMEYLASDRALERRANPRSVLPECESILVAATNYHQSKIDDDAEAPRPKVASYALGLDYHEVLVDRMTHLVEFIQREVGGNFAYKIYSDTGPVLERELAMRAGLGWIGKNTCLIHPQAGSYFLLSEAFLGFPLPTDEPFTHDFCGNCTRCLEACPTRCILPDRTLDARKCISYLTIELKDSIDPELRKSIGDWVFGCDICQQVCPWNSRFARPSADAVFQRRPFLNPVEMERLLELPPGKWRTGLEDSPLERPRRKGLLRNACVAAGNLKDPRSLPLLVSLLRSDPEPLVRSHAAWSLGQYPGMLGAQALEEALHQEVHPGVRAEIEAALVSAARGD